MKLRTDLPHLLERLDDLRRRPDGTPYDRVPTEVSRKILSIVIDLLLPALWTATGRYPSRNGRSR